MGDVVLMPGWMTAEQVARTLNVSVRYVYRIKQYLPPGGHVGRTPMWRIEDVEAYKADHPRLKQAV